MLSKLPPPLSAQKIDHTHTLHGHSRQDPYHWLRNPVHPKPVKDKNILEYLNNENAYTDAAFSQWEGDIETIFKELKGRIKQDDSSEPYQDGDYWYYTRFDSGAQYPIYCRKKGHLDAAEEIILDIPHLAKGHDYYQVSTICFSNNHRYVAYAVDTNGSERFTLYFKDLMNPNATFPQIENIMGEVIWSANDDFVFYTPIEETWRTEKVYRHPLGGDSKNDTLVFHEQDRTFQLNLSQTQDRSHVLILSQGHEENEINLISTTNPLAEPFCFKPRKRRVEYDLEHWGNHWVSVIHDDQHLNGRLVLTSDTDSTDSQEVLPHNERFYHTQLLAFSKHLVITGREDGLPVIYIMDPHGGMKKIPFKEAAYDVSIRANAMYDTSTLRVAYSSLATPASVIDIDLNTFEFDVKKTQEIPSGFNPTDYVVERHMATSHDGTHVPISLIYKKGIHMPAPLVLYGYGSYGYSMPVSFRESRFSLIDRGVIYAISHVRGGSEMGKKWYEDGKYLKKKNTFLDFISTAHHLINQGLTAKGKIGIWGGSAGGMLIGATINMAPELFGAAIADVPFVDVMTTMLDTTLPLTEPELKEWGNPNDPEYYHYMLSYSPYDNVTDQAYPHMFVNAGLTDPRVTYWEPAKWVAKLRDVKTRTQDEHMLFLKTEMGKGHFGASGRFDSLKEIAQMQVFILKALGVNL
jgi:oligopeptidase B